MSKDYVVGIDIGGQTTKLGIVDRMGIIKAQTVINSKYKSEGIEYNEQESGLYIEALCQAIMELISKVGRENVKGIGIGAPNANYYKGTIEKAANLRWARNIVVNICAEITNCIGLSATITNDANAAAIGEMTYGAAKGMKDFIEITLGTGVGSGIVINGQLVYGHDGFAGELGHTCAVRDNGRECNCGKTGCLETYASAIGVARTAREWLENSKEPSILRKIKDISSKDVYDAAVNGDKLSKRIFEYTGEILGRQLSEFVAFSAPEAIIMFGGLANAGDLLFKPMKEAFEANVIFIWKGKVKIIKSALKESDAAILGAASLAW